MYVLTYWCDDVQYVDAISHYVLLALKHNMFVSLCVFLPSSVFIFLIFLTYCVQGDMYNVKFSLADCRVVSKGLDRLKLYILLHEKFLIALFPLPGNAYWAHVLCVQVCAWKLYVWELIVALRVLSLVLHLSRLLTLCTSKWTSF